MSARDYRVSTIAILCTDCGNDVGNYPGLHVCPPRPAMPMPSIPSKYQQQSTAPSSYSNRSNVPASKMRPPDLNADALQKGNSYASSGGSSYGSSSRTPTSSAFASGSKTPTGLSFQERMKERDRERLQREREEREAALRGLREERLDASPTPAAATPTTPAAGSGTTLWNRLRAAKEVINATLTGEEKWPESDDSDFEGESHVSRVLRDFADKKDEAEMAAKIAQLEMTPLDAPVPSGSLSRSTGGASRNNYLRDAVRKEPSPSIISSTSSSDREQDDPYGRSLRARAEAANPSERSWAPSSSSVSTSNSTNSNGGNSLNVGGGNRYRTVSDASRDDALSRLEGKSQGDKLANQVSHLGSTGPRARANSPNPVYRPQEPASVPSPRYHNQQLSPSPAGNYSPSPSQRSISPGANRRYDPPSPNGPASPMRYGQPPVSPSYPNPQYRQQQPPPSPSRNDGYGSSSRSRSRGPDPSRSDYDRRPPGPPPGNNNLGAYGQRQQQQQQHQYQQQPARPPYGSSQGNYI